MAKTNKYIQLKKNYMKDCVNDYFNFQDKEISNSDDRAKLANDICEIVLHKNKGSLSKSIKELEIVFKGLNNTIRNFYEVEHNVPLIAYYNVNKKDAKENYGLNDDSEHMDCVWSCVFACNKYYNINTSFI